MSGDTELPRPIHWIIAVVAVLCVVALLAYARGKPGDDGRTPGEDASASEVTREH